MKMVSICSALAFGALVAPAAHAQSNPFVPPQAGMSRAQIEQIVRQEVERTRAQQAQSGGTSTSQPGTPGKPGGSAQGVNGLKQQQGGTPGANTASGGGTPGAPAGPAGGSTPQAAVAVADPVADLLKDGGIFVGCVSGTPIFKDKIGRRAYFTTKELRESNEARRFTRCG